MLTFKAVRLLKKLKKVQIRRDNQIIIDRDILTATTFNVPEPEKRTLKLDADNDKTLLEELEKAGCITTESLVYTICHINSSGWSYTELTARKILREIVRSFLFPAFVALATSIIAHQLNL